MTTFAFEVYSHQKRKDGTYNIKIRVTHNQRKKYISTPYYCDKTDLTKSLKIKNQFYIDECEKIIKDYRHRLEVFGMAVKSFSIERIYEILTKEDNAEIDLQSFFDSIPNLKNRLPMQSAINSLLLHLGKNKLDIREITTRMLNGWIDDLLAKKKKQTVICYLASMQSIYNRAKAAFNDEDLGEIVLPRSPFQRVQRIKADEPEKRAISAEHIRHIASLEYKKDMKREWSIFNLAKDMYLLSFALVGMNLADFYEAKKECFKNGRLTYNRMKTKDRRKDRAEISILVCEEIMPVFEKYLDKTDSPYLFIFKRHYSKKCSFIRSVNEGLKEIGATFGMPMLQHYSARHSWATIAFNDCRIDKYTIHLALNHTDSSMSITDYYIKKDWAVIDKANRAVLDYVGIKKGS